MAQITITWALLESIAKGKREPHNGVSYAYFVGGSIIHFGLDNDYHKYRMVMENFSPHIEKEFPIEATEWRKI